MKDVLTARSAPASVSRASRGLGAITTLVTAGLLLAAPIHSASAQGTVYDRFVSLNYILSMPDEGEDSEIGFGFRLGTGFWGKGRFLFEIDRRRFEPAANTRVDFTTLSLVGGAAHTFDGIAGGLTVFGGGGYEQFRFRRQDPDEQEMFDSGEPADELGPEVTSSEQTGLSAQLGAALQIIDRLQVHLRGKYISLDDDEPGQEDTEVVARLGVKFNFTDVFSVFVEGDQYAEAELTELRAGIGFNFGG